MSLLWRMVATQEGAMVCTPRLNISGSGGSGGSGGGSGGSGVLSPESEQLSIRARPGPELLRGVLV